MKQILVLFLLLSTAPLLAMSRYCTGLITKQALAYGRPRVAPPARPSAPFTRAISTQPDESDEAQRPRREIKNLRARKKILLYSRPVVTVTGVATANYASARFGLSPQELIGSLMVLATMNTIAFHNADEWHSRQIKVAGKKLDELDKDELDKLD